VAYVQAEIEFFHAAVAQRAHTHICPVPGRHRLKVAGTKRVTLVLNQQELDSRAFDPDSNDYNRAIKNTSDFQAPEAGRVFEWRLETWMALAADGGFTERECAYVDYQIAMAERRQIPVVTVVAQERVLRARRLHRELEQKPILLPPFKRRATPPATRRTYNALNLRVATWNSCSIETARQEKKWDKVASLLHEAKQQNLEIIGLTEIWNPSAAFQGVMLDGGYSVVIEKRKAQPIRGGVALAFKNTMTLIKQSPIDLGDCGEALSVALRTAEGVVITAIVAYLIPDIDIPVDKLDLIMTADIIVGDINARGTWCPGQSTQLAAHARGKLVRDRATRAGKAIANMIGTPQATTNKGTAVDLIFYGRHCTAQRMAVVKSLNLSDHFLIYTDITFGAVPQQTRMKDPGVDWGNTTPVHIASFQHLVRTALPNIQVRTATSNTHKFFVNLVRHCSRTCLPMTRGGSHVPGWAPEVDDLATTASVKWMAVDALPPTTTDEERQTAIEEARKASEQLASEAGKQLRKRLEKMSPHGVYKIYSGGESHQRPVINRPGTTDLASDQEMANIFNTVYTAKSPVPVKLPQPPPKPPPDSFEKVDVGEVKSAIFQHNVKGCRDPDGLSVKLLNNLPEEAYEFLAEVFTDAIRRGETPHQWRQVVNSPLWKGAPKPLDDPASYRPVAISSLISRTWERVILTRLLHVVEPKLCDEQFGYRRGRSATHISLMIQRFMADAFTKKTRLPNSVDRNHPTVTHKGLLLQLDSSDAFNCIRHDTIMDQMEKWQVPGYLMSSVYSWLTDRRHRTKVGSALSPWADIPSGVPQGSVLGPLLYIIGTNALNVELSKTRSMKTNNRTKAAMHATFADDVQLWVQGEQPSTLATAMGMWGSTATTWLRNEQIQVSAKSKLHAFDNATRRMDPVKMKLESGLELTSSFEPTKVLGPYLDTDARTTFSHKQIVEDLERVVHILESLRMLLHPAQLRELYFSYGISKLQYAAAVLWDWNRGSTSALQQEMENIHVRAARAICGTARTASRKACLCEAGLMPLHIMLFLPAKRMEHKMVRGGPLAKKWSGVVTRTKLMPILTTFPYPSIAKASQFSRNVTFHIDIGTHDGVRISRKSEDAVRLNDNCRRIAAAIACSGPADIELWTDASVNHEECEPGYARTAAAALLFRANEVDPFHEVVVPAGISACTFSAESIAPYEMLRWLVEHRAEFTPGHLMWPTDSRSLLQALEKGVLRQDDWLTAQIWQLLLILAEDGWRISAVFCFSHCGLERNDMADARCSNFVERMPDPLPYSEGEWWKDSARCTYVQYRTGEWDHTSTNCAIRDKYHRTVAERIIPQWSAKTVRILAQLRTGVCGIIGGLSEQGIACYWCQTPGVLARGGKAIEHLFDCPHDELTALRRTLFGGLKLGNEGPTASLLWSEQIKCVQLAEHFAARRTHDISDEDDDVADDHEQQHRQQ